MFVEGSKKQSLGANLRGARFEAFVSGSRGWRSESCYLAASIWSIRCTSLNRAHIVDSIRRSHIKYCTVKNALIQDTPWRPSFTYTTWRPNLNLGYIRLQTSRPGHIERAQLQHGITSIFHGFSIWLYTVGTSEES